MLTRSQKQEILGDLKDKMTRQKMMVFVDFTGLKVKESFDLRKKLKKAGSDITVAKKTLAKIAMKEAGIDMNPRELKGEVAFVFGLQDEISPAKATYEFSLEHQTLKILGGFFEGRLIGAEEVIALAKVPPREELLGRLVGSIAAPMSNFVNVLQGNIKGLILALNAISNSKSN